MDKAAIQDSHDVPVFTGRAEEVEIVRVRCPGELPIHHRIRAMKRLTLAEGHDLRCSLLDDCKNSDDP